MSANKENQESPRVSSTGGAAEEDLAGSSRPAQPGVRGYQRSVWPDDLHWGGVGQRHADARSIASSLAADYGGDDKSILDAHAEGDGEQ